TSRPSRARSSSGWPAAAERRSVPARLRTPVCYRLPGMKSIGSYLQGEWVTGPASGQLVNPATEEPLVELAAGPTPVGPALAWARERGGPALRRLTFAQRGEILRALSRAVHAHRDELIALAVANGGNTRGDAKFDIDGASGTLAHYADLGAALGPTRAWIDRDGGQLAPPPPSFRPHAAGPP